MASVTTFPLNCLFQGGKVVAGNFDVDALGAVTRSYGAGATPTYLSSAGKFRLTFDEKYGTLVSAVVLYGKSTAGDQFAQLGAYNASNKTLDINLWDVSAAALANSAGTIYWTVVFED